METIKNYLESMFMNMPNTPEVRRAKDELLQMMEDKYTELINEGRTENEAVGVVISEFGNLNELAEDLGINQELHSVTEEAANNVPRRMITFDEAKEYVADKTRKGFLIALGVFLCICCVTGPILAEAFDIFETIGVAVMFVMIAVGVSLFICADSKMKKWEFIKHMPCSIDFATSKQLSSEFESFYGTRTVLQAVGTILCILSFLPAAFADELAGTNGAWENIGAAFLFFFVGIGVFLMVYVNSKANGYKTILSVNDATTMGGVYAAPKAKDSYQPWAATILSVFYATVTCIYISWSFLTFDWHITWVIWPIAVVVEALIKLVGAKNEEKGE